MTERGGEPRPGAARTVSIAVFLTSLGNLGLELVLTRVFSVTTQYHFAFLCISVALFGLSTSGLAIYLFPRLIPADKARERLAAASLAYAAAVPLCLLAIGRVRLTPANLPVFFLAPAAPFFLGGLVLAAAFTHFGGGAGRLYAADLAGASLGCLAVIPLLGVFGGTNAGLVLALSPAAAALALSLGLTGARRTRLAALSVAFAAGIVLLIAGNRGGGLVPLRVFKNPYDAGRVFEAWNAYSRIAVMPQPADLPAGWGMSRRYEGAAPDVMLMNIDADAATSLVRFDGGDPGAPSLDFLDYDVTAAGYRVKRPPGKVCIVGAGGGRDILTALRAGADGVWAVEVNPLIVETVNERFGDFTGRPYTLPGVHAVVDEGRAFLRRSGLAFDLIQLSLIDSWAATSSGAYVLTENSLYTIEAFGTYLAHLAPGGMLSVTRWFYDRVHGETLRVAGLARGALDRAGAKRPADHIAIVKQRVDYKKLAEMGIEVATVLVSRDPLTEAEIASVDEMEGRFGFEVVYRPGRNGDPVFWDLLTRGDPSGFYAGYPLDVRPPTDERPFFFQMVRFRDFRRTEYLKSLMPHAVLPVLSLALLALIAVAGTLVFLILPLALARGRRGAAGMGGGAAGRLLYFVCLGVAFLSIEMPLLQRLILVLGRPIYALAVVLFSLLLASSLGSFASQRIPAGRLARVVSAALAVLVALLVAYAFGMPRLIEPLGEAAPWARVAGSVALILPLGFLMGLAFPAGIRLLAAQSPPLIPWAWALNGAFSVTSSVVALVLAMSFGFAAPFLLGAAAYAAAAALLRLAFVTPSAARRGA